MTLGFFGPMCLPGSFRLDLQGTGYLVEEVDRQKRGCAFMAEGCSPVCGRNLHSGQRAEGPSFCADATPPDPSRAKTFIKSPLRGGARAGGPTPPSLDDAGLVQPSENRASFREMGCLGPGQMFRNFLCAEYAQRRRRRLPVAPPADPNGALGPSFIRLAAETPPEVRRRLSIPMSVISLKATMISRRRRRAMRRPVATIPSKSHGPKRAAAQSVKSHNRDPRSFSRS